MSNGTHHSLATALAICLFASVASAQTPARTPRRPPAATTTAPAAGLVHKSSAYWSSYKSATMRQVFDGAFDAQLEREAQFRFLFGSYVEQFSDNCRAYLPSHYDVRTIVHMVNGSPVDSTAIAIDYRFLPKYDEYSGGSGGAARESVRDGMAILTGGVGVLAPLFDVPAFFSRERCNSATMRQLGENLLRAATGKPSLQAAGQSIAGAAAESDAEAPVQVVAATPTGPFADGCNAFMRDPKTSRYAPSDPERYCKCLADGYRGVMSSTEEVLYGRNFDDKFWRGIAQPQSTDTAWKRLNPVAVRCMQ